MTFNKRDPRVAWLNYIKEALVAEALREAIRGDKLCSEWPECVCGETWRQYQSIDWDQTVKWTEAEFDGARMTIKAMLACIGHRCSDIQFRLKALDQLNSPVFKGNGKECE